jgi:hypothetical protein
MHDGLSRYPSLFYDEFPIIVVGSVTLDGHRSAFSQGTENQVSVSAPGEGVVCAGSVGVQLQRVSGTSVGRFPPKIAHPVFSSSIFNNIKNSCPCCCRPCCISAVGGTVPALCTSSNDGRNSRKSGHPATSLSTHPGGIVSSRMEWIGPTSSTLRTKW